MAFSAYFREVHCVHKVITVKKVLVKNHLRENKSF